MAEKKAAAAKTVTKTYGIGDSAVKANVGGLNNEETRMDNEGRTFVDGTLTFDPSVDKIELIEDDGVLTADEDGK